MTDTEKSLSNMKIKKKRNMNINDHGESHIVKSSKHVDKGTPKSSAETKDDEKDHIIGIGDTINLSDLLFTKYRDYLITCSHNTSNKLVKVKAKDLAGKVIVLHFMSLSDCEDTWSWKAPIINLRDIYAKLHPRGDFEIVFVALRDSATRECLQKIFYMMPPCPAIPLSDRKSIQRLEEKFGVNNNSNVGPVTFIIDTRGVVLQSHATPLFLRYGAAGYPFTNERIQFLNSEDNLVQTQPLSVGKLLASPERDYLIDNKGDQVPLHNLDDKVVGLYFCPCLDGLDGLHTTKDLEMVYQQLSNNTENFEIVLIYTHGWCEHEDTCCLMDEDSFLDEIKTMPWLALPFKDTNCIKKLQRVFQYPQELVDWPKPDARLVIIGPRGEYFEPYLGTSILLKYGAPAYPFTFHSAVTLELERAKKVKPAMFWELDTVFTQTIGSQVRFSQFVGKRIIILFGTYNWSYNNTLRELKARYFKMKGTDDEFEVINIPHYGSYMMTQEPVPWLMYPAFDQDSFAYEFCSSLFSITCGLLAFDRDGSVVRVKTDPQLGDKEVFPFYSDGDMENEVMQDVKKKIGFRLECVYSWF